MRRQFGWWLVLIVLLLGIAIVGVALLCAAWTAVPLPLDRWPFFCRASISLASGWLSIWCSW